MMKHVHLNKQRGVVLLVALIALVALSLSGIALMRSVDTSNIVSGNFAFNEATTQMAEIGSQDALAFISGNLYENALAQSMTNCNAGGPTLPSTTAVTTPTPAAPITNAGTPGLSMGCPHFYSTYFTDINPATNLPNNFPPNGWSAPIDVPNLPVNCQATPGSCDYTVQYFIERMCTKETWKWDASLAPAASAVAPNTLNPWQPGAPTFRACLATPIYDTAGVAVPNRGRLYYRITVQVNGPRSTRSLVQNYIGLDDTVLSTAP
jgi:Tfp pilus assembly protein PilX